MANTLLNGPAGENPAASPAPGETVATWGYKGAEAKIFQIKPGEKLPTGWSDAPAPVTDNATEAPNDDGS